MKEVPFLSTQKEPFLTKVLCNLGHKILATMAAGYSAQKRLAKLHIGLLVSMLESFFCHIWSSYTRILKLKVEEYHVIMRQQTCTHMKQRGLC